MATVYPAQIDNLITLPSVVDSTTPVSAVTVNRLRDTIFQIEAALGIDPGSIYSTVGNRLTVLEQIVSQGGGAGNVIVHGSALVGQAIIWNGSVWIPSTDFVDQNIQTSGELVSGPALSTSDATGLTQLTGKLIMNAISPLKLSDPGQGVLYFDHSTNQFLISQNGSAYVPFNNANAVAGGDLSGNYPDPKVVSINGATVPAAGALVTGNVLQVNGSGSLIYAPVDVGAGSAHVQGVLPAINQAAQILVGDVNGTTGASTVVALRGIALQNTAPVTGQALVYNGTFWGPNTPTVTLSGDTIGTNTSSTVVKINGADVPISGALVTGNLLQVTGSSSLGYGPINLNGGASVLTGVLPNSNQQSQAVSGDVTGTTTSTLVVAIQGNPVITNTVNTGQGFFGLATNMWGSANFSGDVTASSVVPGQLTVTALQGFPVNGGEPLPGSFLVATNTGSWGAVYPSGDLNASYDGYYDGYLANPGEITVVGLQGYSFTSIPPTQGFFMGAVSPSAYGTFNLSGDISAATGNGSVVGTLTVNSIQGVSISGTPSAGQTIVASNGTSASWSGINIIDGVTISGTPSTGQVIIATSATTADWQNASGFFSAAGDLSGTSTFQTVIGLRGRPINSSAPSNGSIYTYWTTFSEWIAELPSGDVGGDFINGLTVVKLQGHSISATAPTSAQLLEWSGSAWTPTTISGDATISSGGIVTNTGLRSISVPSPTGTNTVLTYNGGVYSWSVPTGTGISQLTNDVLAGPGSGSQVATVVALQTVPISATAPTTGQVLEYNGSSWTPTSTTSSFTAGGDLSGTSTDQTVIGIQTIPVSATPPTSGQVLEYNGTDWTPFTLPISYPPNGAAGGDLASTYPNPVVVALQTYPVNPVAPTDGDVLTWDGIDGYWKPEPTQTSAAPSGTGIPHIISGIEQPTATLIVDADVDPSAAIAYSKLNLTGDIVNADISAGAAIVGSKIVPSFGSQNVSTTGTLTAGDATVTSIKDTGLSTGVVHSDVLGNFTSSAVNLASGDVTGVLPTANQAAQTMGGNVSGTTAAAVVVAIQNNDVRLETLGVNQDGYVLTWDNTLSEWRAENPNGGGGTPGGLAGGDLGGFYPDPDVVAIQSNPILYQVLDMTEDGYVLTWDGYQWSAAAIPTITNLPVGGDLSGTTNNAIVSELQGNLLNLSTLTPAQDGYVLSWTGSALEMLPVSETFPDLFGDVVGPISANTLMEIQGNPIYMGGLLGPLQDGYVLTWDNSLGELVMEVAATGSALEGDVTGSPIDNTVGQRKTFLFMGA